MNGQIQKILVANRPFERCKDENDFTIIGIADFLLGSFPKRANGLPKIMGFYDCYLEMLKGDYGTPWLIDLAYGKLLVYLRELLLTLIERPWKKPLFV